MKTPKYRAYFFDSDGSEIEEHPANGLPLCGQVTREAKPDETGEVGADDKYVVSGIRVVRNGEVDTVTLDEFDCSEVSVKKWAPKDSPMYYSFGNSQTARVHLYPNE